MSSLAARTKGLATYRDGAMLREMDDDPRHYLQHRCKVTMTVLDCNPGV